MTVTMSRTINSIALLVLALAVLAPSHVLADSADLSVRSPATVSPHSMFTVDVNISGITDLFAYQFDLGFNPSVVTATGISEGPFLSGGGSTFFIPGTIDNVGGSIIFNADTLLGLSPGVSGSGTLLSFDFTANSPGKSDFTLQNEILLDSNGNLPAFSTTNGSTIVKGSSALPEPPSLPLLLTAVALVGLALKKASA